MRLFRVIRHCSIPFAALALTACDGGDKTSKVDDLVSANQVVSSDPVPKERKPKFDKMPDMAVDNLGAYIGGFRAADLDKEQGRLKLKEIVEALPIKGEQVTLRVIKKAKMQDVVETVWALGKKGAPTVLIKTDARDELGKELVVTPQNQIKDPKGCSVCTMVTDKASTGVWPFKGGMGQRHRKGFAGPDLSGTQEALEKNLKRCDSDTGFFTAAYNMPWEHGFAMGALFKKADPDDRIQQIVLLDGDTTVAGRAVKLRK
jgi:hypothetical protein